VRGDSLQDLYAKVAAVLGLGVLALSGAVVDYWPVSGPLPQVAAALARPGLPAPRAVAAAAEPASSPRRVAVRSPLRIVTAERAVFKSLRHAFDVVPAPDAVAAVVESPMNYQFVPAVATSVPAEVVGLSSPEELDARADAPLTVPISGPSIAADQSTDEGFITSTMKKTGTSIVRTGVRTGTSIRDAVRVIGSKVRAVFPG
jgi:hypothetical protein